MRKKTNEEFLRDLHAVWGNEYIPLEVYQGTHTKILFRHTKCNQEMHLEPASLLLGQGCRDCGYKRNGDNRRWTDKIFKQKVKEKYGDEYTVLGTYKDSQTKIKIRHNPCKDEHDYLPASFIAGHGCTHCNHRKGRLSDTETFKKKVHKLYPDDEYVVLGVYDDVYTPILMKHTKCGREFSMRPNNILNGQGCKPCKEEAARKKRLKDAEQFKDEVRVLGEGEYIVLGKYEGTHTPIELKHLVCNHKFNMEPNAFIRGERCNKCAKLASSRGERAITKYLTKNNIPYKYGFRIPDLKDKQSLHFDFWLPQYQTAIEYDGQQHYMPVNFGGIDQEQAEYHFNKTVKHDQMKNQYCKDHDINLIRIPYDQKTDEVLDIQLLPIIDNYD